MRILSVSSSTNYFEQIEALLTKQGIARPVALLDLDRVDHNLDLISSRLRDRLRVVTKSLPCLDLLQYVFERTACNRLMAFHVRFLPMLVQAFPDADILMGKTLLIPSIREFYESGAFRSTNIQWLADTDERLQELVEFSDETGIPLKVNFEVDIGLHRGGLSSQPELIQMLERVQSHSNQVTFTGFMGYEVHVPYYPEPNVTFDKAMTKLLGFAESITSSEELTINSGGSSTYYRFQEQPFVNDVSVGSAVVKPAAFNALDDHEAALMIAAPVLKRLVQPTKAVSDQRVVYYLYGGGWPAEILYPNCIERSPANDSPNENLLPNQSQYLKSPGQEGEVSVGDMIFFQPLQSDAMFQFESVLVHRGGELVDWWQSFPEKY